MIRDSTQRKHLLLAQMMLERAELVAELDNVRRASSPPQLARGLFGSVLGGTAGSGLVATLLGSLMGRFGGGKRSATAPGRARGAERGSGAGALLGVLLRSYPMLATTVAAVLPLLKNRRALKGLAIGAAAGALVWQVLRLRRSA